MFIDNIPANLETKSDDSGIEEVKGALAGLTDDVKARLDEIEAKLARPNLNQGAKDDEPTDEQKSFATYLRHGDRTPADELKTLTVSSDPQGGYLAPAEMSAEFIRNLVEYSPADSDSDRPSFR